MTAPETPRFKFNAPPGWPADFDPRDGEPQDPSWPPAPVGWTWWLPAEQPLGVVGIVFMLLFVVVGSTLVCLAYLGLGKIADSRYSEYDAACVDEALSSYSDMETFGATTGQSVPSEYDWVAQACG